MSRLWIPLLSGLVVACSPVRAQVDLIDEGWLMGFTHSHLVLLNVPTAAGCDEGDMLETDDTGSFLCSPPEHLEVDFLWVQEASHGDFTL
jgi:hypothetical protein